MSARWFRFLIVPIALAALLVPGTAISKKAKVGNLTRISGESPFEEGCADPFGEGSFGTRTFNAEAEVSLAVDPSDPDIMVAAWMQDLYAGIVTAATSDGGRSWTTSVPELSFCSGGVGFVTADPWVSIGGDGTVYLLSMWNVSGNFRLQVTTSVDGGLTWSPPSQSPPGVTMVDRPTITADPYQACVAHVTWTESSFLLAADYPYGQMYSRTGDCGQTWSVPTPLGLTGHNPDSDTGRPVNGRPANHYAAEIHVLPDGTLVAVWFEDPMLEEEEDTVPHRIMVSRSTDGGAFWSTPDPVVEYVPGTPATDPEADEDDAERFIGSKYYTPSAEVGPDGSVHIAYHHQLQNGHEIRVITSTDDAKTWGEPTVVAQGEGHEPFMLTLAVAGNGTLGITSYDLRNDVLGDEELTTDMYLAYSTDGAQTWREEHLAGPFDLRTAMYRVDFDHFFLGDYFGMVGLPRGFGAAFSMAKPLAQHGANDVFFAEVRVKGGKPRR